MGTPPSPSSATPSITQALGAECAGTFFLTFVAAGADIFDKSTAGGIGHTARYLAPGCLVTAMIWTFSGISGAHINPAVTLAFVLRGCFPIGKAFAYWAVQMVGALGAGLVLLAFFHDAVAEGVTHPGAGISQLGALSWEALLTLLLLSVILGTSEQEAVVGKNVALAVGLTVALCGLFSSPLTGASMNPARSLGPAIVSGDYADWWIYVAGPLIASALAAGLVFLIHGRPSEREREAAQGKHRATKEKEDNK